MNKGRDFQNNFALVPPSNPMGPRLIQKTSNCDQSPESESLILATHQILTSERISRTKFGVVEVSMNLHLTDPRLIALAATVIVIVAVGA